MRHNAARLPGCLLLRWRGRLHCTPVVYAEGDALHARPRRRSLWRRLIRLRWRMGRMDVLFTAIAAAAAAAALSAVAAAVATLAALATLAAVRYYDWAICDRDVHSVGSRPSLGRRISCLLSAY